MIRVTIKNNNIGKLFLQYVSVNVSRLMSQGVLWFIQSMLLVYVKKPVMNIHVVLLSSSFNVQAKTKKSCF